MNKCNLNLVYIAIISICCNYQNHNVARATETSIHITHAYPEKIIPHPELGKFRLKHDPNKPVIACYGGIGLHNLGNGQWTCYNISSQSDIDNLIFKCRKYGINRLYVPFLEEWTPTRLLMQPPANSRDMVAYAVDIAHKNNIAVYATIAVFGVSEKDKPFLTANPDTLTHNSKGEITPYMFSPAYTQVRAYKRAVILEWLTLYPVDGIQLDFIRWPYFGNDLLNGYCTHGYDEPLLGEFSRKYRLPAYTKPEPNDLRFCKLRSEYIEYFIKELRQSLQMSGITLPLGVYNSNAYGRVPSFQNVCQDWQSWEIQNLVDEHHPMFLLDNMARLTRATQSLISVKRKSTVFGPVFLAEAFEPDQGFVPTDQMCRNAAKRLIKMGCDGIWLCRNSEIEKYNLWPVINEISNYSINQIRQETFDPLYENLLANADFENGISEWKYNSKSANSKLVRQMPEERAIQITLTTDSNQTVTQSHRFCTHPAMAVRSLQFAFWYKTQLKQIDAPAQTLLHLEYTDNTIQTKSFSLRDETNWKQERIIFQVPHDSLHTLKNVTVEINLPSGDGLIWLRKFELIYDPLDIPASTIIDGRHGR